MIEFIKLYNDSIFRVFLINLNKGELIMDVGEIISNALKYPFNNIKALVVYIILGIIAGIAGGASILGMVASMNVNNVAAAFGSAGVGAVVLIILGLIIEGYTLDIIKLGIERRDDSPSIDIIRQIFNAIKIIIVNVVYYIIPVIIVFVLALFLRDWILYVISFILFLVFSFAQIMAKCRLAKTESLGNALAVGESIGDISRVGIGKLLATIIIVAIVFFVIYFICGAIAKLNATVGAVLLGILGVYLVFFYNRAIGLLYSDV